MKMTLPKWDTRDDRGDTICLFMRVLCFWRVSCLFIKHEAIYYIKQITG